MPQAAQQTEPGPTGSKCVSVDELLKTIKKEISDYEARKLGQLKSELESFSNKKKTVEEAYALKYPVYVERWRTQNKAVAELQQNIKCILPDWRDLITRCICKPYAAVNEEQEAYDERKACCVGPLEAKRDATKAALEASKAYLDILTANGSKAEAALGANEKTAKAIREILQGPDKALAVRLFWLELLPLHLQLAPTAEVDAESVAYANGETLHALCGFPAPPETPRPVPWLVHPGEPGKPDQDACADDGANDGTPAKESYGRELDCAWTRYRDAKADAGLAEAAYSAAPDDLEAEAKKLKALKDGLVAAIDKCLKGPEDGSETTADCGCGDDTQDGGAYGADTTAAAYGDDSQDATTYGDDTKDGGAYGADAPDAPADGDTTTPDADGYAAPKGGSDKSKTTLS
jgi:hypothetical protein